MSLHDQIIKLTENMAAVEKLLRELGPGESRLTQEQRERIWQEVQRLKERNQQ